MQPVQFLESAYQTLIEFDLRKSFHLAGQRFVINTYSGQKENSRGYDLEACALVPLFLQLKVSNFYPAFSKSPMRTAREAVGIVDNPGFYAFSLHPDKKSATYKQHNLLAALHAGGSYSRYIAPMFHESSDLEHFKYSYRELHWGASAAGLWDHDWHYWRDYLSFDHSISIIPHKHVGDPTTVSHHYAYSQKKYVSFHSEAERTEGGSSFMESVYDELSRAYSEEPMSLSAINDRITHSLARVDETVDGSIKSRVDRSPTALHLLLARRLKRNFNIDCVLVSARR